MDEREFPQQFGRETLLRLRNPGQIRFAFHFAEADKEGIGIRLFAFFDFAVLGQGDIEALISPGIQKDQHFVLAKAGLVFGRLRFGAQGQPVYFGVACALLADLLQQDDTLSIHGFFTVFLMQFDGFPAHFDTFSPDGVLKDGRLFVDRHCMVSP